MRHAIHRFETASRPTSGGTSSARTGTSAAAGLALEAESLSMGGPDTRAPWRATDPSEQVQARTLDSHRTQLQGFERLTPPDERGARDELQRGDGSLAR